MDRTPRGAGWKPAHTVYLLLIAATISGCTSAAANLLWVAGVENTPAKCKALEGRRVAVVCRSVSNLKYRTTFAARDLADSVGRLLKERVRKIELVDPREVARWTDENDWDEAIEVGEAVDADVVVAIDLEQFSLFDGQTLYRGRANVVVSVYDLKKDREMVFQEYPPEVLYPPNTGVPISDKQESQFQREFVQVLGHRIARLFYPHDSNEFFASDSLAFR